MLFKVGRSLAATLIVSLLTQISYAELKRIESKVAFTSANRDGRTEIFVVGRNAKNRVRLTIKPARNENPTWSPDGEKVAFQSSRQGARLNIWVIDANGKNLIRLSSGLKDTYPDWSPDGKKIVYQSLPEDEWGKPIQTQRYEIYVIDSDGKNKRKLTEKGSLHPCWSPDSSRIAYSFDETYIVNQIYIMDSDGMNQTELTHDDVYKRFPTWSPNGNMIAYAGGQRIWVMDSDGENQRQLTWRIKDDLLFARDEHPTWAPSGSAIAFHSARVDGRLRIYVVDIVTGDIEPILDFHGISNYQPDWYDPSQLSVSTVDTKATMWGKVKVR